jgi:hypothetical protein
MADLGDLAELVTPAPPGRTAGARAPRRAPAVPRLAAGAFAALAGLALLAVVGAAVPEGRPGTPFSAIGGAADPCVTPAAVATLDAWPAVAAPATADEYEVNGERRPDALVVSREFRAFQACRRLLGG